MLVLHRNENDVWPFRPSEDQHNVLGLQADKNLPDLVNVDCVDSDEVIKESTAQKLADSENDGPPDSNNCVEKKVSKNSIDPAYHETVLAQMEEFNRHSMTLMAGCLFKQHNESYRFPGFIELIYLVTRPELVKTVSKTNY